MIHTHWFLGRNRQPSLKIPRIQPDQRPVQANILAGGIKVIPRDGFAELAKGKAEVGAGRLFGHLAPEQAGQGGTGVGLPSDGQVNEQGLAFNGNEIGCQGLIVVD